MHTYSQSQYSRRAEESDTHDNLLLIGILERLAPLNSIASIAVPSCSDGSASLDSRNVASQYCYKFSIRQISEERDLPFIRTVSATSSALCPVTICST